MNDILLNSTTLHENGASSFYKGVSSKTSNPTQSEKQNILSKIKGMLKETQTQHHFDDKIKIHLKLQELFDVYFIYIKDKSPTNLDNLNNLISENEEILTKYNLNANDLIEFSKHRNKYFSYGLTDTQKELSKILENTRSTVFPKTSNLTQSQKQNILPKIELMLKETQSKGYYDHEIKIHLKLQELFDVYFIYIKYKSPTNLDNLNKLISENKEILTKYELNANDLIEFSKHRSKYFSYGLTDTQKELIKTLENTRSTKLNPEDALSISFLKNKIDSIQRWDNQITYYNVKYYIKLKELLEATVVFYDNQHNFGEDSYLKARLNLIKKFKNVKGFLLENLRYPITPEDLTRICIAKQKDKFKGESIATIKGMIQKLDEMITTQYPIII